MALPRPTPASRRFDRGRTSFENSVNLSVSPSTGLSPIGSYLAVHPDEPMQPCIHGWEIVFPTPLPFSRRKFRIAALQLFFEVNPHACHHFQVLHHGAADAVGNALAFGREFLKGGQQAGLEV